MSERRGTVAKALRDLLVRLRRESAERDAYHERRCDRKGCRGCRRLGQCGLARAGERSHGEV